ncbi:MAG: hypothetical protein KAG28_01020 [Cocleimonas sp.]|nr:hypothetical protein [Cocleimonas sp.]
MLRFLVGIVLVQITTVILVLVSPNLEGVGWLRLIIPLAVISFFAAFWMDSLASSSHKDEVALLKDRHTKEKAKIHLNAERAKTKLVKQTQKEIAKEAKITHAKANFKVGASFAAAIGAGAIMLITELFTVGLLTLTTAGGALGGYVWRIRKESKDASLLKENAKVTVINTEPPQNTKPKTELLAKKLLK